MTSHTSSSTAYPRPANLAGALLVLALCTGCTTPFEPPKIFTMPTGGLEADTPPPPRPDSQRKDADAAAYAISAEQVVPASEDTRQDVASAGFGQIPANPAAARLTPVTDADDPCIGDLAGTERCRTSLEPNDGLTLTSGEGDGTLTVVVPSARAVTVIDPASAVNEIGRGKAVSQAAQSAGSEFLMGTGSDGTPPPPDEDDMLPDFGTEGLPIDVLIPGTQQ